jgi:hypothetical protein
MVKAIVGIPVPGQMDITIHPGCLLKLPATYSVSKIIITALRKYRRLVACIATNAQKKSR